MNALTFHLLLPGKLAQNTGGYHYDRRIVEGLRSLGWHAHVHELDESFPDPDTGALEHAAATLARLPDDACVVVDGLALGAMPGVVSVHADRLHLVGLVHHPLALETGLAPDDAGRLHDSEQRALASTCAVITTSVSTATALHDYAVPEARISTVSPGVDLPASSEDGLPRTARHTGKAATDGLKLLCVATLTRRKGHDVLVDALQRLADAPWNLVCVGSDQRDRSWADDLRSRIELAGLSGRIRITGDISASELEQEYSRADVFVLASRHEGYGMVFDEAIAHGLPVVATTAGAIVDTVPAAAGLLVPPNDPQALANALSSLIGSGERLHDLREGACQARARLRSWDTACTEFATVLKGVVQHSWTDVSGTGPA